MSEHSYANLLRKISQLKAAGSEFYANELKLEEVTPEILSSLALHSVKINDFKLFKFLVDSENINMNQNKDILFRKVCILNRVDMFDILIGDKRVNHNACEGKALLSAVECGNEEIVKKIIESGKIDVFSRFGKAFRGACEAKQQNIVNMFKAHKNYKNSINSIYYEVLVSYIRNKREDDTIEYLNELIEKEGMNVKGKKYETLLCLAGKHSLYKVMQYLIDKGIDVNCKEGELINDAFTARSIEKVRFLIKQEELNLNVRQGALLRIACNVGFIEGVDLLLDRNVIMSDFNFLVLINEANKMDSKSNSYKKLLNKNILNNIYEYWISNYSKEVCIMIAKEYMASNNTTGFIKLMGEDYNDFDGFIRKSLLAIAINNNAKEMIDLLMKEDSLLSKDLIATKMINEGDSKQKMKLLLKFDKKRENAEGRLHMMDLRLSDININELIKSEMSIKEYLKNIISFESLLSIWVKKQFESQKVMDSFNFYIKNEKFRRIG